MISAVVVVRDELADALLELSLADTQIVAFQQDPIFHRAVILLDLALYQAGGKLGRGCVDALILEPPTKLARQVGWPVIAQ